MAERTCDIAIVGCGLGGVAAAIAIRKAGHWVTLYEKAPAPPEIGAGIQLPYNCTRILKRWNILPLIESISVQPSNVLLRAYRDGSILFKRAVIQDRTHDTPHLLTQRADFLSSLVQEAVRLGVVVRFNSTVTSIDFTSPAIELSGHEVIHHDVIFGADGQNSFCRQLLLGHPDPPQMSGDVAYRIVIPVSEIKKDKELASLLDNFDISCWMGPNAHVVSYQLKKLYNLVLVGPDTSSTPPDDTKPVMHEINARFGTWDPQLQKLLQLAPGVLKRRLLSSHEMSTWRHAHGAFALIGDACHVSTPHLAQGAAQAIEDGAVLGDLFNRLEDKSQIKHLLGMYEAIRKPRTTCVIARSEARRAVFQLPDGDAQEERDGLLRREVLRHRYPDCVDDAGFQAWLLDYDVEVEVEKAWQLYKRG